ncbi:protein translocase SEC61 complex gamma subunit, archaeal and eukaryotic [Thermoplasmatales archaeon SCGC AB-539-N05]|nr:protein translocase SEC61 complex gamma subunit, archaeal and eukaryotic [Thermoplasmatales archaeon SCGC AB-539-N05]
MERNKRFVDKALEIQHKIEVKGGRIGKGKYGRVLTMARKPTDEEYSKTSKITGLGILVIGAIGFVIYFIMAVIAPWIAERIGF